MKRLRIILFGVLFVILSYAISHAFEIDCAKIRCKKIEKEEGSETFMAPKIAWDAVTDDNISHKYPADDYKIGYLLYITQNKAIIEDSNKKRSEESIGPLFVTELNIAPGIFSGPGLYYVGVSTAIYDKDKVGDSSELKPKPEEESIKICWSDIGACTNYDPFVFKVEN